MRNEERSDVVGNGDHKKRLNLSLSLSACSLQAGSKPRRGWREEECGGRKQLRKTRRRKEVERLGAVEGSFPGATTKPMFSRLECPNLPKSHL